MGTIIGLVLSAALWAQSSPSQQTIVTMTVCQIVRRPDDYNGRRVRFHAMAESDGIEHTILTDSHCDLGIAPIAADQGRDDPGIRAFDSALSTGTAGTAHKKITAIFSGRFEYHAGSIPRYILRLEHVSVLKVVSTRLP